MGKVKYRWSDRSKPDLCNYNEIVLKNDSLCHHCGKTIPASSEAVCLQSDRGEIFYLHKSCANKSCINVKENRR